MTEQERATKVVNQMMENDHFSQWLGIERMEEGAGKSILKMVVRKEMLNGFGVLHGGVSFAFADSAFAFASNTRGRHAVSVETSISHTKAVMEGDILTAIAEEEHLSYKLAIYKVVVINQKNETVALFKGTVYRKEREWDV